MSVGQIGSFSNNVSIPWSAKADTSPQSREGLKYYHLKNYTEKAFNNARELRKKETITEAEKLLWYYIKNRHLRNYRFRRQVPIQNYIIDFLCPEKN